MTSEPHVHYEEELETARKVQQGLLASQDIEAEGFSIAHTCIPAQDIGGDFYIFERQHHQEIDKKPGQIQGVVEFVNQSEEFIGVGIGDVAGHGVSSALVMALSAGILKQTCSFSKSPHKVLGRVNNSLVQYLGGSQVRYVTALYCMIFLHSQEIRFSKAGHVPGLLLTPDGTIHELKTGGLFLGMYPDETYETGKINMPSGSRLILFTDGIVERKNKKDEQFGDEAFHSFIKSNASLSSRDFIDQLFSHLDAFAEGLPSDDDQTIVVIDRD